MKRNAAKQTVSKPSASYKPGQKNTNAVGTHSDRKTIEVLADEKAKEMLNTWRSDDEGGYKEQIRSLKESHARQTERIEKLEKDLAEEKTKCAGLENDASHMTQLHKLEVDNLLRNAIGAFNVENAKPEEAALD